GMSRPARRAAARERAVLVGLHLRGAAAWEFEDSLEELRRLVESAGAEVLGVFRQRRDRPDPSTLIGRGKAAALAALLAERDANLAVFEHELTPGQERTLAETLGVKVLDRTDLILDIFAQRARTREGRLQVEVAQLARLLPRLVGKSPELSRLGGGIGTRGPGETRLESDRRRVRERLAALRGKIAAIGRHRALYQRRRRKAPVPVVALVGYTNAGKSTLLNALSGSQVLAEDRLFSTLDPTSRRIGLPGGGSFVLTDTVGFIRHIPPQLTAAFTATLGELHEADLLLHVTDASHPAHEEQRETVLAFLRELGLDEAPRLEVYSKIDRLPPGHPLRAAGATAPNTIAVSAVSGAGLEGLLERVRERVAAAGETVREILVPYERLGALVRLRREGRVLAESARSEGLLVRLRCDEAAAARLARDLAAHTRGAGGSSAPVD
ncbi:MAG TPA: GTPase HflX, partial [Candidatus Methanoperedens sp.]|nr:GTPase HflX [Candidatus Methanoperedens sp.]